MHWLALFITGIGFYLEAEDSGDKLLTREVGLEVGVGHEEEVGERGAEVSPVCIGALLLGGVDILAARAVHFHSGNLGVLTDGDRQHMLFLAHDSRASAEATRQVALPHDGKSLGSVDVAGVEQSVELSGVLVDLEEARVVDLLLGGWHAAQDHLVGLAG